MASTMHIFRNSVHSALCKFTEIMKEILSTSSYIHLAMRAFAKFLDEMQTVTRELQHGRGIDFPRPQSQIDGRHLRHGIATVAAAALKTHGALTAVQITGVRRWWQRRRTAGQTERLERRRLCQSASTIQTSSTVATGSGVCVRNSVRRCICVREIFCTSEMEMGQKSSVSLGHCH